MTVKVKPIEMKCTTDVSIFNNRLFLSLLSGKIYFHLTELMDLAVIRQDFPVRLPVNSLKALTFFYSGYMSCPPQSSRFTQPDYTSIW